MTLSPIYMIKDIIIYKIGVGRATVWARDPPRRVRIDPILSEEVDHATRTRRKRPGRAAAQARDKAVLARAAALERLDLTSFILRAALPRAQAVITDPKSCACRT